MEKSDLQNEIRVAQKAERGVAEEEEKGIPQGWRSRGVEGSGVALSAPLLHGVRECKEPLMGHLFLTVGWTAGPHPGAVPREPNS